MRLLICFFVFVNFHILLADSFISAEKAFFRGDYSKARRLYQKILSEEELANKIKNLKGGEKKREIISKAGSEKRIIILLRLAQLDDGFSSARIKYMDLIKKYPKFRKHDQMMYELGELYFLHPNYSEAVSAFEKLLKVHPKTKFEKQVLWRLGQIYLIQDRQKKAVVISKKILKKYKRSPFRAKGHYICANSFYDTLQYKKALKEYLFIEKRYNKTSIAAFSKIRIGDCYYALSSVKQARLKYSEVIKLYPGSEVARVADFKLRGLPGGFMLTPFTGRTSGKKFIIDKGDLTKKRTPKNFYYVQVAALRKKSKALITKGKLHIARLESKIITEKSRRGTVLYKILVGPYKYRRDADKAKKILKKKRYKGIFIKKIKE